MMRERIISIDVLRGLTILLMIVVNTPGSWSYVYAPLLHAKWHGCTPTDLVFPSFLFIVGLTLAISFKSVSTAAIPKALKRAALIFLVGVLLNWFPFYQTPIDELRIFGVLQRIALAFAGAAVVLVLTKGDKRYLVISAICLLVGHWLLLRFFGDAADPYSLTGNFSKTVDDALLSEKQVYGGFGIPFDPEGLLGTLSSIAQVLTGYLTAKVVMKNALSVMRVRKLALAASSFILVALLLDQFYPINKPLWTGSYALYTSGIIMLVWAFMIWLIDFQKIDRWTFPFRVVGINPLISYVLSTVFAKILYSIPISENESLYGWLYENAFQSLFGNYLGSLSFALVFTGFIWLIAFWMYRRKIVVKL